MSDMRTLGEFIVEKQHEYPHASGELSSLLSSIRLAAKIVNREINKAGWQISPVPLAAKTFREKNNKNSTFTPTRNSKQPWPPAIRCVVWPVKKKTRP